MVNNLRNCSVFNFIKGYGLPALIILACCIAARAYAYYVLQPFTDKIISDLLTAIIFNTLIFLKRRKIYKSYLFSAGVSMPLMLDIIRLI